MGIDKSLSRRHPSVVINGSEYQYGREKNHGQYLVENASIAKDYWAFDEKEDLQAFLVNLPESAERGRHLRLHPDWHEVTAEQRTLYMQEDRAALRALAEEKMRDGTAHAYDMDLEGERGPHEPRRIPDGKEPPLGRAERQVAALTSGIGWHSGLSEAGRLRMLEGEVEWRDVEAGAKSAVLSRELDFSRITAEQFAFVYEDIAHDKMRPADASVARRLFDEAHAADRPPEIRDTTRNLIESVMLDSWPRNAAIVDFGLDSQAHYEALYYPIREGEISPQALDEALGHGPKLTALARGAPSNPHRDVEFSTSWDEILGRTAAPSQEPERTPESSTLREVNAREWAEAKVEELKNAPEDYLMWASGQLPELGRIGGETIGRWDDWTPTERLAALESIIPWEGVEPGDKRSIIEREIDFISVSAQVQLDVIGEVWRDDPPTPAEFERLKAEWREDAALRILRDEGVARAEGIYEIWQDHRPALERVSDPRPGAPPEFPAGYTHVADVRAGSVAEAFVQVREGGDYLAPDGPEPWVGRPGVTPLVAEARDMRAGDVIVDTRSRPFRVEAGEFVEIPPRERPGWQTEREVAEEERAGAAEDMRAAEREYHRPADPIDRARQRTIPAPEPWTRKKEIER